MLGGLQRSRLDTGENNTAVVKFGSMAVLVPDCHLVHKGAGGKKCAKQNGNPG